MNKEDQLRELVRSTIQAMRIFKYCPVVYINQKLDNQQTWAQWIEDGLARIDEQDTDNLLTQP